jgi:Kef-type K+ transport system membrane component KefB
MIVGGVVAVAPGTFLAIVGVFVPFFFIVSGMELDVSALFASPWGLARLVLFFALFLVVRGVPALVLYRDDLNRGERRALAFLSSTQLPLVVAITALATQDGHMRPSTAAALVGAAVLSTLVFPIVGIRIAAQARVEAAVGAVPDLPEVSAEV